MAISATPFPSPPPHSSCSAPRYLVLPTCLRRLSCVNSARRRAPPRRRRPPPRTARRWLPCAHAWRPSCLQAEPPLLPCGAFSSCSFPSRSLLLRFPLFLFARPEGGGLGAEGSRPISPSLSREGLASHANDMMCTCYVAGRPTSSVVTRCVASAKTTLPCAKPSPASRPCVTDSGQLRALPCIFLLLCAGGRGASLRASGDSAHPASTVHWQRLPERLLA